MDDDENTRVISEDSISNLSEVISEDGISNQSEVIFRPVQTKNGKDMRVKSKSRSL